MNAKQFLFIRDVIIFTFTAFGGPQAHIAIMLKDFVNRRHYINEHELLELNGDDIMVEREIEGGKELVNVSLPAIVSCSEGVAEPKIPNMRGIMSARTKPLEVIEGSDQDKLTNIIEYTSPAPRSAVKILSADETEKLVELLHTEAKVI